MDGDSENAESPILKSSKAEFEDPLLTPESEREDDIKEEKVNVITDTILHMMLCELDVDKGVNKALNKGEQLEEMPSFLTRGIQTDSVSIAQYLYELFSKIKVDKEAFLESLATPLNRDALEILGHLQDIESDSNDSQSENIPFQQSVLPVELYLENEKQRRINKMSEDEKKAELDKIQAKKDAKKKKMEEEGVIYDSEDFDDDDSIMAEWENIHNKVIFDWVNEILDNYRPYGLKGPPLPWSTNLRTLTYKYSEQERVEEVLYEVQDKIMTWAETEAGTLTDSDTILNAPMEIRQVMTEKQFLTQIREERLARLLSAEINEAEPLWLDYEYEETQVKLDIADMILQELCFEGIKNLTKLENRFKENADVSDIIDQLFDEPRDQSPQPIILPKNSSPSNVPVKPLPQRPKKSAGNRSFG